MIKTHQILRNGLVVHGKPGHKTIYTHSFDVFNCGEGTPTTVKLGVPTLKEAQAIARKCKGSRIVILMNRTEAEIVRIVDTSDIE